jgi:tRNA(fMet)-specific endonuclease VapC
LPITDEVIVRAADIYASLKQRGELISDADILIASTALISRLGVVTNNLAHFRRIPELQLQNWLEQ